MSFSGQVDKFAKRAKERIQEMSAADSACAEQMLHKILGQDALQIKSISYDQCTGKLHSIDAPHSIVDRLRAAALLRD